MACYSPDVRIETLAPPLRRWTVGGAARQSLARLRPRRRSPREIYADLFRTAPDLHAEILHRIVHRNYVVDHERVTGQPRGTFETIAIYQVEASVITRVWFIE